MRIIGQKNKLIVFILNLLLIISAQTYVLGMDSTGTNGVDDDSYKLGIQTNGGRATTKSPWPKYCGNEQNTGLSEYNTSENEGILKWKYASDSKIYTSPTIGSDGTIYFGCEDNNLYAINPDGTEKWKFQTGDRIYSSPTIGHNGNIYFGSDDYYIYALNSNGERIWKYRTDYFVRASPVIGVDNIIYIPSFDGFLYALTLTGGLEWKFEISSNEFLGEIACSPMIDQDGYIYIGAGWVEDQYRNGYLYSVARAGLLKWKYQIDNWVYSSPAMGSDGSIYVGGTNSFYALNKDGTLKWSHSFNNKILSSPAIGLKGNIYFGTNYGLGGGFFAYTSSGNRLWKFSVSSDICSSPAISSDGTIYFGCKDNYLYALTPQGYLKWKFNTGADIYSSPAIGSDGTIYVGSTNGELYALRELPPIDIKTESGNRWVNITWEIPKSPGSYQIDGFKLYRRNNSNEIIELATFGRSKLFYNDTLLENGKIYHYLLSAFTNYYKCAPSEVTAIPKKFPGPPLNLKIIENLDYISLIWSPPEFDGGANVSHYKIFRGHNATHKTQISILNSTKKSFIDWNITLGIDLFYHVTAVNIAGESGPSNYVNALCPDYPSLPKRLNVITNVDYVELSWDPVDYNGGTPIMKYNIFRGKEKGFETLIASLSSVNFTFIDTSVSNGEIYYYYITASNYAHESQPSEWVTAEMPHRPSPPRYLILTSTEDKMILTWTTPIDDGGLSLSEIRIYRGTAAGVYSVIASIDADKTYYNDLDLKPGKKYYYYVTSVNDVGESNPSNEVEGSMKESKRDYNSIIILAIITILIIIVVISIIIYRRKKSTNTKASTQQDSGQPSANVQVSQLHPGPVSQPITLPQYSVPNLTQTSTFQQQAPPLRQPYYPSPQQQFTHQPPQQFQQPASGYQTRNYKKEDYY